jgi:hypothetical protein
MHDNNKDQNRFIYYARTHARICMCPIQSLFIGGAAPTGARGGKQGWYLKIKNRTGSQCWGITDVLGPSSRRGLHTPNR